MIGGLEPPNSGNHFEMSSSSPMAPWSTKVMNVAAVSHFVDEAMSSSVAPDMPPMACSWITVTVGGDDPDHAAATARRSAHARRAACRWRRMCRVRSPCAPVTVVGVVVVTPTVVGLAMEVDVTLGAVGSLDALVPDDPQATSSSPATTNAATRRNHNPSASAAVKQSSSEPDRASSHTLATSVQGFGAPSSESALVIRSMSSSWL